jgi:hypothetical protein
MLKNDGLFEHPAAQIVVERRHLTQFRKGKARQEGIEKMSIKHEGQRRIRCPSTAAAVVANRVALT